MTKKQIKKIAEESYTNNVLNEKKTEKIGEILNRKELKLYINELKKRENEITIVITLPSLPKETEQIALQKLFPNKKIRYNIDESLVLGMKIEDNDLIYEMNMRSIFNHLITYVVNTYDR